ncbi:hypothetical protein D3C71_1527780 [compost metagenome]
MKGEILALAVKVEEIGASPEKREGAETHFGVFFSPFGVVKLHKITVKLLKNRNQCILSQLRPGSNEILGDLSVDHDMPSLHVVNLFIYRNLIRLESQSCDLRVPVFVIQAASTSNRSM